GIGILFVFIPSENTFLILYTAICFLILNLINSYRSFEFDTWIHTKSINSVVETNYIKRSKWINIVQKAFLKKKAIRTAIIFGFCFKMLMIIIFVTLFEKKPSLLDPEGSFQFVICLMISPIIIFNYVFNNLWGYLKHIWLILFLSGRKGVFRLTYIKLLLPVLFVDFLFFIVFVELTKQSFLKYAVFYFCCLLIYLPLSFITCVLRPKPVSKAISFNSFEASTSVSISAALILITFILHYFSFRMSDNILPFLIFIIGAHILLLLLLLFILSPQKIQTIYEKIF
ncbi:MAG: hypothetical protein ABUL44_02245, partial [Flavobacterium sp.]